MAKKQKKIKPQIELPTGTAYRLSIFFINCPRPITCSFSGAGDSGSVEDFEISGTAEFQTDKNKEMLSTFNDALRDYAGSALELFQPGWEINEGSSGVFTFYPNGAIEISIDVTIVSSESYTHQDTWNGITTEPDTLYGAKDDDTEKP